VDINRQATDVKEVGNIDSVEQLDNTGKEMVLFLHGNRKEIAH
jgi:hypothetical protein